MRGRGLRAVTAARGVGGLLQLQRWLPQGLLVLVCRCRHLMVRWCTAERRGSCCSHFLAGLRFHMTLHGHGDRSCSVVEFLVASESGQRSAVPVDAAPNVTKRLATLCGGQRTKHWTQLLQRCLYSALGLSGAALAHRARVTIKHMVDSERTNHTAVA